MPMECRKTKEWAGMKELVQMIETRDRSGKLQPEKFLFEEFWEQNVIVKGQEKFGVTQIGFSRLSISLRDIVVSSFSLNLKIAIGHIALLSI